MTSLESAVGSVLGAEVVEAAPISGGDMAAAFRIRLDDGRTVFAKTHPSPPVGFFGREAFDLDWLADAAALPVPEVLAVSDGDPAFLVLSWVEPGTARRSTESAFGAGLADLHRAATGRFGRADRRTTGSLALPNEPADTWAEFYAECRLRPLTRIARDRNSLARATLKQIEGLAARLEQYGGADEPPARLHGDLWAGNRLIDADGASWLIDPASHGGHREFDLAMMRLFGGFGDDSFAAYDDVFPLSDGWADRIPLHQLAPLMVHAIKFGSSYPAAVGRALDALGA